MRGISPKQRETLLRLMAFNRRHGYFPSIRELCSEMQIASTNTIQVHLKGLIEKGYLERQGSQARALRLTGKAEDEFGGAEAKAASQRGKVGKGRAQSTLQSLIPQSALAQLGNLGIPLLGQVPAGPLSQAVENNQGEIDLADILPVDDRSFALIAQGDSMVDKGIQNGDLLIVRQQAQADSGDIVVALLDGETTVKTLLRRTDGITLQPANDLYESIRIPLNYSQFQICGKVVGIIRRM